jgi:hypothetical protein
MKSTRICLLLLPVLVFSLLIPALAVESGSTSLRLGIPTVVSGTELKPGEYQVKWVSGSPECQVTLFRRGKPVVEFRAKLVNRDAKVETTATSAVNGPDGKPVIREIRIGGTKSVLILE